MSNQEIIRRKQFCQISKNISGSDQYLVVGIDVAKNKHHAFMGTARGRCVFRRFVFENNIILLILITIIHILLFILWVIVLVLMFPFFCYQLYTYFDIIGNLCVCR